MIILRTKYRRIKFLSYASKYAAAAAAAASYRPAKRPLAVAEAIYTESEVIPIHSDS